jgi:hypothetical protein
MIRTLVLLLLRFKQRGSGQRRVCGPLRRKPASIEREVIDTAPADCRLGYLGDRPPDPWTSGSFANAANREVCTERPIFSLEACGPYPLLRFGVQCFQFASACDRPDPDHAGRTPVGKGTDPIERHVERAATDWPRKRPPQTFSGRFVRLTHEPHREVQILGLHPLDRAAAPGAPDQAFQAMDQGSDCGSDALVHVDGNE